MSASRRVEVLDAGMTRRTPWRNGRGATEELALWPRDSSFERGDFRIRISRAALGEPGEFSVFRGFERILVVVAGEALALDHGEHAPRARLRPLEPYSFSGDWPTSASLPRGPIEDFNVITLRGAARAQVLPLRLGRRMAREALDARHALLHVLAGRVTARLTGEEEPFELGARDNLRIDEARTGDELEILGASDDARALLVRLHDESASRG